MKKCIYTKHELKKKDFYTWLKQTLENAGWENISSKSSTDFDVFYSTGESGTDEIYFQMKEYYSTSTTSTLSGSTERFFEVKPLMKYIPGEPGVSGTYERTNEQFHRLQISTGAISLNADMTVYYNVNKNRITVMTEFPIALKENSVLFTIGKPDEHLSKYYENGSMIIFTTTSYNGIAVGLNEADSTKKAVTPLKTMELITPTNKNSSGLNFMSELAVGSSTEGIKAIIDGVYVLADSYIYNTNANRGDIFICENGNKYRIFYLTTRTTASYDYYVPTRYMALMIE